MKYNKLPIIILHSPCRRDGWQTFSSVQLWEQLVNHTKKSSRDHAALSDIYTCHIVQRCNQINEDLQRIYKKVLYLLNELLLLINVNNHPTKLIYCQ